METWLNGSQFDEFWKRLTQFNSAPLQLHTMDRMHSKGGGVALICKDSYGVKLVKSNTSTVLECGTWEINTDKKTLIVTILYHPPPKAQTTNGMFIDELTDYLTASIPHHDNNILMRDFNLHIDDPSDNDAVIFNDTMHALGLDQHVQLESHTPKETGWL